MILDDFNGKKVLILGYGTEGKATEAFIRLRYPDISIIITDQNRDENYLQNQNDYDFIIKTPGIPKRLLTKPYTTATNIFFDLIPSRQVIGITGSKGKSTTASLIAHILHESGKDVRLIGNFGTPALSSLLKPFTKNTFFVYELSSYQLDDIKYSPFISVIVSLFPDHIPYHSSTERYYEAKQNIIKFAGSSDYFIYNDKFATLKIWAKNFPGRAISYEKDLIPKDTKLIGEHNYDNIRAAITVARILNISDQNSLRVIKAFKPLPHRLEKVGTYDDITFYDDAISTTPESTIAALKAIQNVDTILLGGENRGYKFQNLVQELTKQQISNIVLFPNSGKDILSCINEFANYNPKIIQTLHMSDAIQFAYQYTHKGSVCLLSTASPSYSIWKNYIEKGMEFQTFIKKYAQKKNSSKTTI